MATLLPQEFDSSNIPVDGTLTAIFAPQDRLADVFDSEIIRVDVSANVATRLVAKSDGKIAGIQYANGAVAADGTNGWRLLVTNKSDSDAELADFGIGSGTNAALANDTDTVVAANGSAEVRSTATTRFNKGDVFNVAGTRDGTTITGTFTLVFDYADKGR